MDFPNGIYFNEPSENTKDWNHGKLSIIPDKFIEWLKSQTPDEKGYIKLQIATSKKTGKIYMAVDNWKPTFQKKEEIKIEELPF